MAASGSLSNVAARFDLKWNGEQYEKAAREATVASIRIATREVAKAARRLAPRAPKHRVYRRYPGWSLTRSGSRKNLGYERPPVADPKRISQSIVSRTMNKPGKAPMGMVKANVGYAVFVNYDRRVVARGGKLRGSVPGTFFMQKALISQADRIIGILKGQWPK